MILYYCRFILSFVTYVETFVVTDVPEDVTAVPVVTYLTHVLCDVMTPACFSTFRVHIKIKSKIRVRTIVGSNTPMTNLF